MQAVGELHATPGEVPHKICLPIGTRWPSERVPFITAYPDFDNWSISEAVAPEFYKNVVTDSLYWGNGCEASLTMTDPYGNPFANDDTDKGKEYYINIGSPEVIETIETTEFTLLDTDIVLWPGNNTIGNEHFGDWREFAIGSYASWADLPSGKVIVVGTVDEGKTAQIRVRDKSWIKQNPCFIDQTSYNGYAEFTLDANDRYLLGKDGNQLCIDGQYFTLHFVIFRAQ